MGAGPFLRSGVHRRREPPPLIGPGVDPVQLLKLPTNGQAARATNHQAQRRWPFRRGQGRPVLGPGTLQVRSTGVSIPVIGPILHHVVPVELFRGVSDSHPEFGRLAAGGRFREHGSCRGGHCHCTYIQGICPFKPYFHDTRRRNRQIVVQALPQEQLVSVEVRHSPKSLKIVAETEDIAVVP